ncbi:MAG: UDP-N-acetylmuramate--L-alanine ligase [Candidatus Staskawiczbacteria bacterium RIFCSPHIGHO2_02_FULL_34_9]|uniref:UDP-N-acetylmuramate--L-alanine ligase n=1 Tax=Candidatus Staskawiczbacteria bacterium RIFCSPHIGHO2_02_FULL_34_9 TaxID=1802206 RepID=A0A1G2HXN8_9BACT|nr:MAG: UDP-N-acetylmuramate--L-alanine ligase [Candidatus Staskawiczbacteria bacterium RIFCSPHIGHO2_02_FULL_34_9]
MNKAIKIHCIGIGGIGVSALAQYYLSKGHQVSGSDLVASEITDLLKEKGIEIIISNSAENIKEGIDMVVFSPAVPKDNPEYKRALELGIKLKSYPEALGQLTKEYYTIAVAGAHGKSTTTAMIGLMLEKAGFDPTVIVGTLLKEFGNSNFREGKGKYLVIEACEYDGSFLEYQPKIEVITNVDKEHLDYFGDFETVLDTFKKFILKLPEDGYLISNGDDKNLVGISKPARREGGGNFKTEFYSLKDSESAELKKVLQIPGDHNVSNALSVLKVAKILGIESNVATKALSEYKGSWRRFEIFEKILNKPNSLNPIRYTLISDYGHHPNEISATLNAAREKYANNPPSNEASARLRKLWLIFQPHQYKRTHYLFDDFVEVFKKASVDEIIITDIYDVAGREEKEITSHTNSKMLTEKINKPNVRHMSKEDAERYVKGNISQGDVLIIMGAGDIYKLVDSF